MSKTVTYACDRCGAPATERRTVYKMHLPYTSMRAAYDMVARDYCDGCAAELDGLMATVIDETDGARADLRAD